MRNPLLVATATSFLMHSAIVLAFVSMPDIAPGPDREQAPTEVSLGPQFTPASAEAPTAPIVLQQAKPVEQTASDAAGVEPLVAEAAPVQPPQQLATLPEAQSLDTIPEATLAPPAEAAKPAPDVVKPAEITSTLAESAPRPATDVSPGEAPVSDHAAAIASGPADALAGLDTRPGEIAPSASAAPLFPSDSAGGAIGETAAGDRIVLPVIASDDSAAAIPDGAAQAVDPNDLPSVSDIGPNGEASRNGAGATARAKVFEPPSPKRPPTSVAGQGGGKGGSSRAGAGEIYDPAIRSRYSTGLFTYLRRKLVFPGGGVTGTVTVRFILDRSGRILQSGVVGSSGSADLDSQALGIVQRAAPFPRFPDGFGSSQLEVTLPVVFR